MLDQTIINKWLESKGDEALRKLLNHEPLTFEDDIVLCLVGQREEIRLFKLEIDKRFDAQAKETNARFETMNVRFDTQAKEMEARFVAAEKSIDARFELVDERFDRLEKQIKESEKRIEYELSDIKVAIRELQASNSEMSRRIDDVRKEMVSQTRWMPTGMSFIVALVMALAKIFDMMK